MDYYKSEFIKRTYLSSSFFHNTAGNYGAYHLYDSDHDCLLIGAERQTDWLWSLFEDRPRVHQDYQIATSFLRQHHVCSYTEGFEGGFVFNWK